VKRELAYGFVILLLTGSRKNVCRFIDEFCALKIGCLVKLCVLMFCLQVLMKLCVCGESPSLGRAKHMCS